MAVAGMIDEARSRLLDQLEADNDEEIFVRI